MPSLKVTASRLTPISHLVGGLFFYRYHLFNNYMTLGLYALFCSKITTAACISRVILLPYHSLRCEWLKVWDM